ncbi:MAG: hypothetical protein GTN84_12155 [Hydrogenophaga sp.]|uniref:hypothetical protein n=1 Tax=Hydrogenophaga sp. TaxID=1904254 RepID=UPI0016B71234|nr:hypothetical protein [Hydrogenophaga sp.]NIM41836.1 hypothetical protein [Hydrogenophaga sp.]NIN27141.1 hypothetical protein [Hydrogenophaga sp.]NIN31842.1 hypothetical protein [Hydrogenophaga sp.]NIN56086.1 hypothetical protein [Hydrogenophaga sp.]NIO52213.1 hypothetical protein [Hydrogenophaga sp.]
MARSSIQGTSPAPSQPGGRDTASLGPGDSSDSGSDMMGIADDSGGDPGVPADVASSPDAQNPTLLPPDALASSTDAAGTGESRSASDDGGRGDGWDVGTDQVFTPGGGDVDTDEDPDLAFIDEAQAGDPAEDEGLASEDDDETPPPRPVKRGS